MFQSQNISILVGSLHNLNYRQQPSTSKQARPHSMRLKSHSSQLSVSRSHSNDSINSKTNDDKEQNSNVPMALMSACPINISNYMKKKDYIVLKKNSDDACRKKSSKSYRREIKSLDFSSFFDKRTSSSSICATENSKERSLVIPSYSNKKTFNAALNLYNRRSESLDDSDDSSSSTATELPKQQKKACKQHWVCKGKIRASLQLCTTCKDVGKPKNFHEQYYIDTIEVRKYRTVLCKACISQILKEEVGVPLPDIEKGLHQYTRF